MFGARFRMWVKPSKGNSKRIEELTRVYGYRDQENETGGAILSDNAVWGVHNQTMFGRTRVKRCSKGHPANSDGMLINLPPKHSIAREAKATAATALQTIESTADCGPLRCTQVVWLKFTLQRVPKESPQHSGWKIITSK